MGDAMDTPVLLLLILIAVIVLGAGFYFLRPSRKSTPPAVHTPPKETDSSPPHPDDQPSHQPPEPRDEPEVGTPTLDKPEAPASRMVRLRSRLAQSGTLGSALLAVLSRDNLSEEDWEEIEE